MNCNTTHYRANSSSVPGDPTATLITLARLPLLLAVVLTLYQGTTALRILGAGLLLLGLLLDTVDGVVARRTGTASLLGSVLDIAADRIYELVLWVCFADLGLIPVAIPLVVIARTALTDALRSIGVGQGAAPFDQQATPLGRFLVGSAWMRTGYSVSKVTAFCGLALVPALGAEGRAAAALGVVAWVAVGLCVLRGIPVLVGSGRWLRYPPAIAPTTSSGSAPVATASGSGASGGS